MAKRRRTDIFNDQLELVTIYLPVRIIKELEKIAAQTNSSSSQLASEIISDQLEQFTD